MPAPSGPGDAGTFRFRHPVEVRFRDLDPMGHAHHSLALIYFEEARGAYWREVVGRTGLEGIDFIMGETHVRHHARVRYPARLEVGVRVTSLGAKSFTMEYELRTGSGELLASGRTAQVMYDYAAACSKPIPPEVRRAIRAFEGGVA